MFQTIAVIGAKGFVGKAICNEAEKRRLNLIRIHRGDDIENLVKEAAVVIHAANPSARYAAEKNPHTDFMESVEKTHKIKILSGNRKVVLISSISARTQLYTVYGRHRRASELILDDRRNLIVRLGPMFGEGKRTGPLYDIINNNTVYVGEDTRYAYVNVAYNAKKILDLINTVGVIELGAKNSIGLAELKEILNSSSNFTGPDDTQIPLKADPNAPDARDVIPFALNIKRSEITS